MYSLCVWASAQLVCVLSAQSDTTALNRLIDLETEVWRGVADGQDPTARSASSYAAAGANRVYIKKSESLHVVGSCTCNHQLPIPARRIDEVLRREDVTSISVARIIWGTISQVSRATILLICSATHHQAYEAWLAPARGCLSPSTEVVPI